MIVFKKLINWLVNLAKLLKFEPMWNRNLKCKNCNSSSVHWFSNFVPWHIRVLRKCFKLLKSVKILNFIVFCEQFYLKKCREKNIFDDHCSSDWHSHIFVRIDLWKFLTILRIFSQFTFVKINHAGFLTDSKVQLQVKIKNT